jgi:hypothetical protein
VCLRSDVAMKGRVLPQGSFSGYFHLRNHPHLHLPSPVRVTKLAFPIQREDQIRLLLPGRMQAAWLVIRNEAMNHISKLMLWVRKAGIWPMSVCIKNNVGAILLISKCLTGKPEAFEVPQAWRAFQKQCPSSQQWDKTYRGQHRSCFWETVWLLLSPRRTECVLPEFLLSWPPKSLLLMLATPWWAQAQLSPGGSRAILGVFVGPAEV